MKPKTLILMVVAITCGLGASYMTSRLLAERGPAEEDKVKVLVLKRNMNQGEPLKRVLELFEEKDFVRGQEPKDAFISPDQLQGKVLKRSLRAGDFVRAEDVLNDKEVSLSHFMPEGYRAIGIRVNAESIAGGFASLPHSRVDIVNTVRRGDDRSSYSQLLLENVLVLAADSQINRAENGQAMVANVVTVALKPEDSLKIALARELGPLSLVLRRFNDNGKAEETKITVEGLQSKTLGKEKDEIVEATDPATPPVAVIPKLDPIRKDDAKPVTEPKVIAKEEPKNKVYRMRIIEGDRERFVDFLQDESGAFIQQEVNRTDLTPPRPDNNRKNSDGDNDN